MGGGNQRDGLQVCNGRWPDNVASPPSSQLGAGLHAHKQSCKDTCRHLRHDTEHEEEKRAENTVKDREQVVAYLIY